MVYLSKQAGIFPCATYMEWKCMHRRSEEQCVGGGEKFSKSNVAPQNLSVKCIWKHMEFSPHSPWLKSKKTRTEGEPVSREYIQSLCISYWAGKLPKAWEASSVTRQFHFFLCGSEASLSLPEVLWNLKIALHIVLRMSLARTKSRLTGNLTSMVGACAESAYTASQCQVYGNTDLSQVNFIQTIINCTIAITSKYWIFELDR